MEDFSDQDGDNGESHGADGDDHQQGHHHTDHHLGGGGSQIGEDGQGDNGHHDTGGVGLAQSVLIQEAQLLAEHTEDQAPHQLIDSIVEQTGDEHGQQGHQNYLGQDHVRRVVLGGQGRDELLAGSGSGLFSILRGNRQLTGIQLGLDTLGLALQAQGGNGVAHKALGAHHQRREHRQLGQIGLLGHLLHLQGGHHTTGEDGRAHQGEAAVNDQLADEVYGGGNGDAGHRGDDDSTPLGAEVAKLDGRTQVHQQHGDQQAGHAQQRGIGKHGGGENAGPEAHQKDNGGDQQHGNDGFGFGGDHVSGGEHHKDDSRSKDCIHNFSPSQKCKIRK